MVAATVDTLLAQITEPGAPAQKIEIEGRLVLRSRPADRKDGPMQGFDPKFKDSPTISSDHERDLEDRGIATLQPLLRVRYRRPVARIGGQGQQCVIAATMATQAEFPDRTLYGED